VFGQRSLFDQITAVLTSKRCVTSLSSPFSVALTYCLNRNAASKEAGDIVDDILRQIKSIEASGDQPFVIEPPKKSNLHSILN